MKALVTGGAGFIGSHVSDRLIEEGYEVVIIDNLSTGTKDNINQKAKFYKEDICSNNIENIFQKEKPDYVFHLAAQIDVRKSVEEPLESARDNILGSLNILENSRLNKVKKIIFFSTGGAIYGEADIVPTHEDYPQNPLSPYGIEKLSVEKYLNYYQKVFNLPYTSLRLGNVYGPRQNSKGEAGVIAIFCDKMINGEIPLIHGTGETTRDFIYIDDVVEAVKLSIENSVTGIYNIGTGKETDVNTIFGELKRLMSYSHDANKGAAKSGEQKRSCLDCSKAKKELNWKPRTDFKEGLKKTLEWFKSRK